MADNLARILADDGLAYQQELYERRQRKAKAKRTERLSAVVGIILAFSLAFTIVSRYMAIAEQQNEITAAENNLNNIKSSNDQKEVMLESAMTLEELEENARVRLGMNKPANNQIVYVCITKEDTACVVKN
ncbi:MAG: septum formation initiator family protein [Clostridia bacterium]|nr:septum formation initiator family protein [Clostridia bacterium]